MSSLSDLVLLLEKANEAYRNTSEPIMSDSEYDTLLESLRIQSPNHPFLKKIGAAVPILTPSVPLPFPMASLDKIKDDSTSLAKFAAKWGRGKGEFIVSDKLDGNSGGLVFEGGTRLYSRGDGSFGQNLDTFLPFIRGIPTTKMENVAVRGELILSKESWKQVKHLGTHPRNLVAGALHRKTPDPEVASRIEFVAYELIKPQMSVSDGFLWLRQHGFQVVNTIRIPNLSVEILTQILLVRKAESEYDCDGIVVSAADIVCPQAVSGKNPKHAFAWKSMTTVEDVEVSVTAVEWNVSKDSLLKPVVHFLPVVVSGATLAKATGFNAAFIRNEGIGPGARLVICRSGDVIPFIKHVVLRAPVAAEPPMPYIWSSSGVEAIATDSGDATLIQQMIHFVTTLGGKRIGPAIVVKLFEKGVKGIVPLWKLTRTDIANLEIGGDKTADLVWEAILMMRRNATWVTLAVGSNKFGHGFGTALLKLVLPVVGDVDLASRRVPPLDKILECEGMGQLRAQQFIDSLPIFYQFLDELGWGGGGEGKNIMTTPQPPNKKQTNLQVVFSGVRDKKMEQEIVEKGGKVTTAVSSKTTHLIVNDLLSNTTKVQQARELGVAIMTLSQFQTQMLL